MKKEAHVFCVTLNYEDGTPKTKWREYHSAFIENDEEKQKEYFKKMIERFNESLKPGERKRVFVLVRVTDQKPQIKHDWEKASLVTEKGMYDRYRCRICGATGKRYMYSNVVPDKQFTQYCKL